MLLLDKTVDWVLSTSSTTCSIKANLGEVFSSETRILFFSNLPVTWCKSLRLVHSQVLDQSWLIGIGRQHLYPTVICWLICRLEQIMDYVIVQTPDPFPQRFISRTDWNSQNFWTMNTKTLSLPQVFQSFSEKCKSHLLQSCGKEFIRFLSECIVNLLEGNRRSRKRHRLTEFQNESRLISVKRITWKQRRDNLASEKVLQLGKVHTLSVINHLSWHGAVCSRSWFCIQQEFECPVSYKVGTSKVSTFMKSHVPNWFAWEGSN